jgi:hypothetical protein
MTTRYQFLAQLHDLLQPKVYVDIGVQCGHSLALARPGSIAYGVDPKPMITVPIPANLALCTMTSDEFFAPGAGWMQHSIDFASIDGMHLFEYALRDFMGCEQYGHTGTVVVFDDVAPYNSAIASREQPPGDWTGDVWKIRPILDEHRPDLTTVLVDTFPTGTLVVWGLDQSSTVLSERYQAIEDYWTAQGDEVPAEILRNRGVPAQVAIEMVKMRNEA